MATFLLPVRAQELPLIRLRVATFNLHHGADPAGRPNLAKTAGLLRQLAPEVIALQEIDRRFGPRSLWQDQPARLARALGMAYVFAATIDRRPHRAGWGEYGLAVLSRLPILAAEFILLPGRLEQRGVLVVWLQKENRVFPLACTHLGLAAEDRRAQVAALKKHLPSDPALLLLGDFNAEATAEEIRAITVPFTDLQAAAGKAEAGTFVHHGRPVRIDYLFAGPAWQVLDCHPVPSHVSDHYPVVAELILATNCQPINHISVDN